VDIVTAQTVERPIDFSQNDPMDRNDIAFALSIAGFVTSSVLAIIKGFEFYSARRANFTADVRLTSSEQIGNTVVLLNKSGVAATISYYELVWTERRRVLGWPIPFFRKVVRTDSPIDPPDGYDETVAPQAIHRLWFGEEYHFDWGYDLAHDVYLKIWLVGRRRPIWLWVTGPKWEMPPTVRRISDNLAGLVRPKVSKRRAEKDAYNSGILWLVFAAVVAAAAGLMVTWFR
jgi:hypothetical protein